MLAARTLARLQRQARHLIRRLPSRAHPLHTLRHLHASPVALPSPRTTHLHALPGTQRSQSTSASSTQPRKSRIPRVELVITSNDEGRRLDRFVWKGVLHRAVPKTLVQRLLRQGKITLQCARQLRADGDDDGDEPAQPLPDLRRRYIASYRLEVGDCVLVPEHLVREAQEAREQRQVEREDEVQGEERRGQRYEGRRGLEVLREELPGRVLFRDEDVIAIDKPYGVSMHAGTRGGAPLDLALDALQFEMPAPPQLVHRLDRHTTGVVLLARHPKAAALLADTFAQHKAEKAYWALVNGPLSKHRRKTTGVIEGRMNAQPGEHVPVGDGKAFVQAVTGYRLLKEWEMCSLLELYPVTGRKRQLRYHAAHMLGTPIIGDDKFHKRIPFLLLRKLRALETPPRLHLHHKQIEFPHPTRESVQVKIRAGLPEHFARSLKYVDPELDLSGDLQSSAEVDGVEVTPE